MSSSRGCIVGGGFEAFLFVAFRAYIVCVDIDLALLIAEEMEAKEGGSWGQTGASSRMGGRDRNGRTEVPLQTDA